MSAIPLYPIYYISKLSVLVICTLSSYHSHGGVKDLGWYPPRAWSEYL